VWRRVRRALVVASLVGGGLVLTPVATSTVAAVSVINVTTTLDVVNPADGVVSLREALDSLVADSVAD